MFKVDAMIPVWKPDERLKQNVQMLLKQTYEINSITLICSVDQEWNGKEIEAWFQKEKKVQVEQISQKQFDHGGTRHEWAKARDADFLLFMVQDAVLEDQYVVEKLVKDLENPDHAVAFARQIPGFPCDEIEKYSRYFNYPPHGLEKTKEKFLVGGVKGCFVSNVCAMYRKDWYERVGGFEPQIPLSEDYIFAAKALSLGAKVIYNAEAHVLHAHNFGYKILWERYWNIGYVHRKYQKLLGRLRSESEGLRLFKETAMYLLRNNKIMLFPRLVMQNTVKYLAYQSGKHYNKLFYMMRNKEEKKMGCNKKKIITGVVAVVAAFVMGTGLYACGKMNKINQTEVNENQLNANGDVDKTYLNVAVFGVNDKESDAVYVASMNRDTKEVKLLSVYSNTMMKDGSDSVKVKDVFAKDGAEKTIALLNDNLDLNIKDYVSIDFQAMVDAIDLLGGIEIDVKEEEIPHINGYAEGIATALGKEVKKVEAAGVQVLDGTQATGYCRIRVTDGGDVQRTNRQKEVISKMLAKLKDAKFSQMDKIIDVVFPQIETSLDKMEMITYGKDAAAYKVETIPAFPREIKEQVRKPEEEGVQFNDYEEIVEGTAMEKDVKDIHKELFSNK